MMYWIALSIATLSIIAVTVFFFWNVVAIVRGAPYVPSSKKRILTMISLADLHSEDIVLDLGSGDGRVLRALAPYVREARGIEINQLLVWYAHMRVWCSKKKNIHISRENFWQVPLDDIDVLFVYCIDNKMAALEEKVKKDMKPGSRVVSNGFRFPHLLPTREQDGVTVYVL